MSATDFYPIGKWPAHSAQMAEAQEELEQQVFGGDSYPMVLQSDMEPWLGQLDWSGEMSSKSAGLQPYPKSWYEAGLVSDQRKQLETSWNCLGHANPSSTLYHADAEQRLLSQLATERALFMTPSAHSTYPSWEFPGSPVSDSSGTPEMSHSSRWESEQEERHSRSPNTAPEPHRIPNNAAYEYFPHSRRVDEEESFGVLEMPDGTTRCTANWLPVDSSAGFTIGSDSFRGLHDLDHMEDSHELRGAFFANPTR
ncbi:hypothetical protein N7532_004741 [Penicillium argentinense]|uniref:Uncharacterized protein n=1 Tax=Penicillium argentinense TaxID=1131581 RepID=A0A9W9FQI0_9EURO|nr:uncharacterized protein N7532_004741 [Penicillium argentinense]KAJ5104212.1 hypothetical protein N7532_004741 [Penicillium argentinense]